MRSTGSRTDRVFGALIVDDEELGRAVVRQELERHAEVRILGECSNGFEAIEAIAREKPDLLFLDVQMPKLSGFDVLEMIDDDIAVVFVTAYDRYALEAFDVHAVDYLLKPFGSERFALALARAEERAGHPRRPAAADLARAARPPDQRGERIVLRDGASVVLIPLSRLDYAEAQDDYVALVSEGREHLKQETITRLEGELDPGRFVRIHRSYIANIDRIVRVEPLGGGSRQALLSTGARLPVSRSGWARLRRLLGERSSH